MKLTDLERRLLVAFHDQETGVLTFVHDASVPGSYSLAEAATAAARLVSLGLVERHHVLRRAPGEGPGLVMLYGFTALGQQWIASEATASQGG